MPTIDGMADRHQQKPYPLRIDAGLRERLEASAEAAGRSLNAEISQRLEQSFAGGLDLPAEMKSRLTHMAEQRGRSLLSEVSIRLERSLERDYFEGHVAAESELALDLVAAQQVLDDARRSLAEAHAFREKYRDSEVEQQMADDWIKLANESLKDAELNVNGRRAAYLDMVRSRRERETLAKSFSSDGGGTIDAKDDQAPKS